LGPLGFEGTTAGAVIPAESGVHGLFTKTSQAMPGGELRPTKTRVYGRCAPCRRKKSASVVHLRFGSRERHSTNKLIAKRRNMPRIHTAFGVRTRHRSSLAVTSNRFGHGVTGIFIS